MEITAEVLWSWLEQAARSSVAPLSFARILEQAMDTAVNALTVPVEQRAGYRLHQQVETAEVTDVPSGPDGAPQATVPSDETFRTFRIEGRKNYHHPLVSQYHRERGRHKFAPTLTSSPLRWRLPWSRA